MKDLKFRFLPPHYDSGDARPCFSLLEKHAYLVRRQNATTAACDLDSGRIQATFCAAHPPRASYLCIHATGLGRTKLRAEPQILATEGPLAVIRVVVNRRKSFVEVEYFVYHAGSSSSEGRRPPSLKRIPNPAPYFFFNENTVAIVRHCPRQASTRRRPGGLSACALRPNRRDSKEEEDHDCGDCNYIIAALRNDGSNTRAPYQLCRYHSKTETWSPPEPMETEWEHGPYPSGSACKAITIGGEQGTVAWVDLNKGVRGIIFCDVLTITDSSPRPPVLRCLDMPPKIKTFSGRSYYVREIDLVDGFIVYIELQIRDLAPDTPTDEYVWMASTCKFKIDSSLPFSSIQWQRGCKLGSSEVNKSMRDKLKLRDAETICKIGLPVLSLHEDGIVYILTTLFREKRHTKSWVLAIDMKKKMVQELDEFENNRKVYLFGGFLIPTRITKYLQLDPDTTKQNHKRQKMMLQRHSCVDLPGVSIESHSDMELDDDEEEEEEEEEDNEPSLPEPEAQTPEELALELACKPWLLNLEELVLEKSGKSWNEILQSRGSAVPVSEGEVEDVEEASKKPRTYDWTI
ncbi:uncharacterized protein LOC100843826 isoform X1 [Brachypodium distachyon]|uniref:uncharacterized protein LOC100843826 isoform X2 n=1 Tax=Brachypodium distachyon TaxID=15368 RepID=UPI00071C2040|nr:uncharacterized protein LOC100843826 isoform X2 [Brachypodium distachyon]XP_014758269.1 uncharacterized protein LOC100843826 isoform X1 [Brachypodium distachyon]|eukprot:XP_014758268.2 uncharacterized protein LOC100843826 isoform X2 [Brachypodium distachyon]